MMIVSLSLTGLFFTMNTECIEICSQLNKTEPQICVVHCREVEEIDEYEQHRWYILMIFVGPVSCVVSASFRWLRSPAMTSAAPRPDDTTGDTTAERATTKQVVMWLAMFYATFIVLVAIALLGIATTYAIASSLRPQSMKRWMVQATVTFMITMFLLQPLWVLSSMLMVKCVRLFRFIMTRRGTRVNQGQLDEGDRQRLQQRLDAVCQQLAGR